MSRKEKHRNIEKLIHAEKIWRKEPLYYNCLPPDLRDRFDIIETTNVSAHAYDVHAVELIERFQEGWVLDCGAGLRTDFHSNVVNYEIVGYPSTDVLGVAEDMPFMDECFDAVICLNVLEHVKDPFKAAQEIARVLKPGGKLYCVVPFLQPVHGYPHHYYNMTSQGLKALFTERLDVEKQFMLASGLPIWTLSWFLQSWTNGLTGVERERFQSMTVAELSSDPILQMQRPHVTFLSEAKNFELASTTALFASKAEGASRVNRGVVELRKKDGVGLEKLVDLFSNLEKHYQRELAVVRQQSKNLEQAVFVARAECVRLTDEVVTARKESLSLEDQCKRERFERVSIEKALTESRDRVDELHRDLLVKNALVDRLDREFNLIRRSSWWRFRKVLIRMFGFGRGKG
jgi:SAM-dependent methyltransferase